MKPPAGQLLTSSSRASQTATAVTIVAHDIGRTRGMERQLSELATGLARLGDEVTLIARSCELPEQPGITFRRVRGPARPFLIAYPWFMLAGSLAVCRWRRGIVQATGAIVLNKVDVIAVHYCHQVATATPSRSTWLFRAHVRLAQVLKRWGERICFRSGRAGAVVCVSEGVAEEIREYFPALSGRVRTIHNGIQTADFTPGLHKDKASDMRRRLDIADGRLVVAFVGSEWERKGLRWLIEALALAPSWDLVVAGGGDQRRFGGLADSLEVGNRVHWLGVTRQVAAVYELADAFVLPSSYETFSLVTFEAAASGLPVLATPVNGVRELIEDGHNGFLITLEPRVIAERLERLASDSALRERLGRAARLSTLEYDAEKMIAAHHELYLSLA